MSPARACRFGRPPGCRCIHLDEPSLTGPKRALKRIVDLVIAVPLVVMLAPLYLLIGVAIKFDSLGRALYISDRIGRSGEAFRCMKFRTMHVGADIDPRRRDRWPR